MMCAQFMKSLLANVRTRVEHFYMGPINMELTESMFECDPDIKVHKCYFLKPLAGNMLIGIGEVR